jgi:hypothetical protein
MTICTASVARIMTNIVALRSMGTHDNSFNNNAYDSAATVAKAPATTRGDEM